MARPHEGNGPTRGTNRISAWMQHAPDPNEEEEDDLEPIDANGLGSVCKGHKHGAALMSVGEGLIARGHEICLMGTPTDSIMIGYEIQGVGEGSVPEWFTCYLHADDLIEAAVSTISPEPYKAFFEQDVGDSDVTWFDEPVKETGKTLVRFHIPASDPTAPDLILRFYLAARSS